MKEIPTGEAKGSIGRLSLKKKRQIKYAIEPIACDPAIGKYLTGDLKGLLLIGSRVKLIQRTALATCFNVAAAELKR